jgi:signal transduction histidine kinase
LRSKDCLTLATAAPSCSDVVESEFVTTEPVKAMDDTINVLLVDDNPAKLLTYEAILSELGENLVKTNSGMEAFEQLLKTDIAVVLMDVSMPGMDGFETAQMIHQHPRFYNLPIIFVSGILVSDLDRIKGYRYGAVDYVSVPVIPELLRAKVKVFADLYRKTRELELLNKRIITLRDDERRQIARELHDSIGQLLAGIGMNNSLLKPQCDLLGADTAKLLAENATLVEEAIKQVRTISHLLHPPLLDEAGLVSALRCYVEGFSQRSNILVRLDMAESLSGLSKDMELCIFRVVQECLTNVHRHANSPTVGIRVQQEESSLRVEVEDAGKGISTLQHGALTPAQAGVGLRGMQERLRQFGGTLQIHSNGNGTRITAILPTSSSLPSRSLPAQSLTTSTEGD